MLDIFCHVVANDKSDLKSHEANLRCLVSLVGSIDNLRTQLLDLKINLLVVDDQSSQVKSDVIRNICQDCDFKTEIRAVDGEKASLLDSLSWARMRSSKLRYFTDTNLLHDSMAIFELLDSYRYLSSIYGEKIFLSPWDAPQLYEKPFESLLLKSPYRFWRSNQGLAQTFLCSSDLDLTAQQSTSKPIGFSALPSLVYNIGGAVSENSSVPFVPWQDWWNSTQSVLG